ncbi:MAG: hypothetical protein JETCAE02_28680 [Anaerolineaceae bacterium]|nr:MAG: hypothetical protein JETCAE02_28680 [Anaerolineaceae bacterium]
MKIDSEAHAALRLLAVQRGLSADDARDEAIRIGIAAMSRRRKARRKRKTTG